MFRLVTNSQYCQRGKQDEFTGDREALFILRFMLRLPLKVEGNARSASTATPIRGF
jgi:hypothetical protein